MTCTSFPCLICARFNTNSMPVPAWSLPPRHVVSHHHQCWLNVLQILMQSKPFIYVMTSKPCPPLQDSCLGRCFTASCAAHQVQRRRCQWKAVGRRVLSEDLETTKVTTVTCLAQHKQHHTFSFTPAAAVSAPLVKSGTLFGTSLGDSGWGIEGGSEGTADG